ncbi:MAG: tetratricopeptide repeat protein [Candidatus Melainabacteria bacterium]|nr:tetratricopeptide repeat protein [Candidatus Melainabacteria bacterium]
MSAASQARTTKAITSTALSISCLLSAGLITTDQATAIESDNSALQTSSSKAKAESKRLNEDPTPPERHGSEIFTEETASALLLQAKQYMRHHNYNKALKLLRRAIKLNDDDMDIRVLYAEALDEKLSHQAEKEPEIFNECIKSWLMVARQEVGLEKGMTFKGIGFMSGQYADEDWAGKAKKRLRVLTGYSPKPWETNDRYLKKVLKPAETSVSAVIKSSSDSETSTETKHETDRLKRQVNQSDK